MEDTRPYWKVIVSLAFSLIGTILFIVIGIKLLWFFMPFVIGWFIAFIANPLVCWLEKRLKIVKTRIRNYYHCSFGRGGQCTVLWHQQIGR